MRRRWLTYFLLSWLGVTAFFFFSGHLQADEQDYYQQLRKGWVYLQRVFENLNAHYVDELKPYDLIKAGIDGMVSQLDPYTVFIEEEGQRRLQMITTGKYGGLGIEISRRNGKITVITPIDNTPAKRAGIRAGDIIEDINGTAVSGKNVDEVSESLRGDIGTAVELTINRPGQTGTFKVSLVRSEIIIEDIRYAGFMEDGIAYISLTGFTDKAYTELRRALLSLEKEQAVKGLVLDLRGNPGGLLESAVDIVSLFVPRGELVVSTRGFREREMKFYTSREPLFPTIPIAVLIDNGSASAAEIVAGALQDLDRAVIIGQSSFGKGLVQKVFEIDPALNAKLKITTAKYYIPSGRCIQKDHYGADSLARNPTGYSTRNGRSVYDQGGIYPDMQAENDSLHFIALDMIRRNTFFDFVVQYRSRESELPGLPVLADQLFREFRAYVNQSRSELSYEGQAELKQLQKALLHGRYNVQIMQQVNVLQSELEQSRESQFNRAESQIREILRLELIDNFLGTKARDKASLDFDHPAHTALEVLKNKRNYQHILAIKN